MDSASTETLGRAVHATAKIFNTLCHGLGLYLPPASSHKSTKSAKENVNDSHGEELLIDPHRVAKGMNHSILIFLNCIQTKVNPCGKFLASEEHAKLAARLNAIQTCLTKYSKADPHSDRPLKFRQFLNAHAKKFTAVRKVETASTMISRCSEKIQAALEQDGSFDVQHVFNSVSQSIKTLGMTADQTDGTFYFMCPRFFIEVSADKTGFQSLKVVHTFTEGREEQDVAMLQMLQRADISGFYEAVNRLNMLHESDEDPEVKFTMFSSLCSLESDIQEINKLEMQKLGFWKCLTEGHGIIDPRCGGKLLRMAYFATKSDIPNVDQADGLHEDLWPSVKYLRVRVANVEGSFVRKGLTGKNSFLGEDTTATNSPYPVPMKFTTDNDNQKKYVGVLELQKPLPVAHSIVNEIMQVTTGGEVSISDSSFLPRVQDMLQKSKTPAFINGCKYRFAPYPEKEFRRICSALLVESIPISSSQDIFTVLRLLRQQETFNRLLESCTTSDTDIENGNESGPVVEISSLAPQFIELSTYYNSTMLRVEIKVALGGSITADVQSSNNSGLEVTESALSSLKFTLHIPALIQSILNGFDEGQTSRANKRRRTET
eukprot:m.86286 g.86286  ORF g.86286 m.86286 type:complete len:603 (+) comp13051_c0_seq2:270-2078(+)